MRSFTKGYWSVHTLSSHIFFKSHHASSDGQSLISGSKWTKEQDLILYKSFDPSLDRSQIIERNVSYNHFNSASQRLGRSSKACLHRWNRIRADFFGITNTALSRIETLSNDENIPTEFRLINFVNREREFFFSIYDE